MIGPALVAVAAWCAAGAITVAAPDESSRRLAALAPWWILPIAFALAALVPAWRRRPLLAAPALLSTVAWNVASHVPAGDEPHYLVITQSLLKDGDLRIENNHRQRDYAAYVGGDLAPHYVTRGRDAEIYSIHSPGTPVLVLPAFALFGYRGAEVWLLLLAGLTGSLLWRIGWRATGDPSAAWFAWAAVAGSASFLLHSFAVFPDAPGALAVAAGILLLVRLARTPGEVGPRALVIVSALLGALPWLHTRFAVLAGGLGLLIAGSLLLDGSRPFAARRARARLTRRSPSCSATARPETRCSSRRGRPSGLRWARPRRSASVSRGRLARRCPCGSRHRPASDRRTAARARTRGTWGCG